MMSLPKNLWGWLKERVFYIVSIIALFFAGIDSFVKPISWVTVTLVGIAMLPWFIQYISEIEFPTGVKISMREKVERLKENVEAQGPDPIQETPETNDLITAVLSNPDVALAGLRIEIERRLLTIARLSGEKPSERAVSITQLTRQLVKLGVIAPQQGSLLFDLIPVLNDAVHARGISDEIRSWVIRATTPLLAYLDQRIGELRAVAAVRGIGDV
jgi:hypothetical protein